MSDHNEREAAMSGTGTEIDPRVIAESLQMDTYALAETLSGWAADSLPRIGFEERNMRGPSLLEDFDEQTAKARRYLEAAHESFKAWLADNPDDESDE